MVTAHKKRILICPLNWGLGHASRCIPIIQQLIAAGHTVIIGSEKQPEALLKQEFPELEFISFTGFEMQYAKNFLGLKILFSVPGFVYGIYREHQDLKNIIREHKIDLVISDNRYGCWSRAVKSIFITHQIFIQAPLFSGLLKRINFWFLAQYDAVWIQDYSGEFNLSGALSHGAKLPKHACFIGPQSRFFSQETQTETSIKYDLCIVLSGPEPQRSVLENKLITQLKELNLKTVLVRGLPNSTDTIENWGQLLIYNHLATAELKQILLRSKLVLCRSGYSSIMDMAALGKKVLFIPTPGQTEQEYLAHYFKEKGICYAATQASFKISKALEKSIKYRGFENYLQSNQDVSSKLDLESL